jgi:hypothetical protein
MIQTYFKPSLSFQVRNHSLANWPEKKLFTKDGQAYRAWSLAKLLAQYVCTSMVNAFPFKLVSERELSNLKG